MKEKTKNIVKEESEECCADKDVCSKDCSPKSKKKESKCDCKGCC